MWKLCGKIVFFFLWKRAKSVRIFDGIAEDIFHGYRTRCVSSGWSWLWYTRYKIRSSIQPSGKYTGKRIMWCCSVLIYSIYICVYYIWVYIYIYIYDRYIHGKYVKYSVHYSTLSQSCTYIVQSGRKTTIIIHEITRVVIVTTYVYLYASLTAVVASPLLPDGYCQWSLNFWSTPSAGVLC